MATYANFLGTPNGTRIYNHGFDQCVALANFYHENVLGLPFVPVASAWQWWTNYGSFSMLYNHYSRSNTPVPGAIFVARYGIYDAPNGHIGVVTSVNSNGTFNTMEQNAGTWRYTGRYTRGMSNILGFLIPHNNPAGGVAPTPKPSSRKDDLMLLQDTGGIMYVADDMGFAKIGDIAPSKDNGENVYAARMLFNGGAQEPVVNARQRDLINSLARNRWARIRSEIVADVVSKVAKPTIDANALATEIVKQINKTPGGGNIDITQVTAAVKAGVSEGIKSLVLKAQ